MRLVVAPPSLPPTRGLMSRGLDGPGEPRLPTRWVRSFAFGSAWAESLPGAVLGRRSKEGPRRLKVGHRAPKTHRETPKAGALPVGTSPSLVPAAPAASGGCLPCARRSEAPAPWRATAQGALRPQNLLPTNPRSAGAGASPALSQRPCSRMGLAPGETAGSCQGLGLSLVSASITQSGFVLAQRGASPC